MGGVMDRRAWPTPFLGATVALILVAAVPPPAGASGREELARKAKAVLEAHCHICHGKDGRNEGGMNYALDRDQLVAARKVTPGDAKQSRLVKRVADGSMPPGDDGGKPVTRRPTAADVEALRAWADAGAPDFNPPAPSRAFVRDADVLKLIRGDLEKAGARDRRFLRYFTLTHLHNAGLSGDELRSYRAGLSKLVNSLSWGRRIHAPRPVDPAGTVLRIDLRDYRWDERTWESVSAANPYAAAHPGDDARYCSEATGCATPHARADWFVFAASRPPLYHDVLELPTSLAQLEQRLDVRAAENVRHERVLRAAFNASGVSANNRMIERHESAHGSYWKSYDFAGNVGRQNLFQHPLDFRHDGGEVIFSLPNGLQGYFLCDADGTRLDRGPASIVSDPDQKDRAVVNGISCMKCHNAGVKEKYDEVRPHVEANREAFRRDEAAPILALYAKKEALEEAFREDAERFRKAVEATGAHLSRTEPIHALALRFESEVDLRLAAAEAGVTPEEFGRGLDRNAELARAFGTLRAGGRVKRDALAAAFPDLANELQPEADPGAAGGRPPAGPPELTNGVGMRFVRVPKGTFWAGGGAGKAGPRQATVDSDFEVGAYEVTQDQWRAVTGRNPSGFSRTGESKGHLKGVRDADLRDFPVEFVSWDDAQEFVRKLNAREQGGGWAYRLPSEDEWEFACRAGSSTPEECGFDFYLARPANTLGAADANFLIPGAAERVWLRRPARVGSYPPNGLGLHDMHGNVWEWCGGDSADGAKRVARGGGWIQAPERCGASSRLLLEPKSRNTDVGLRLVRVRVR